jgi:hypothetical protein
MLRLSALLVVTLLFNCLASDTAFAGRWRRRCVRTCSSPSPAQSRIDNSYHVSPSGSELAGSWYKLLIYTHTTEYGGTNGDCYMVFRGDLGTTRYMELDSPGDSHEQDNWDVYYFSGGLGNIQAWDPVVISDARNGIDNWTYSLWLYERTPQNTWTSIYERPNETSFTVSRANIAPVTYPRGAAHKWWEYFPDGTRVQRCVSAGEGPPGVDLCEP